MNIDKLKPVPKNILDKIKKTDKKMYPFPEGMVRFYSYLTTLDKELVKISVAVKTVRDVFYYKQVAVHGIKSPECYVKDMEYSYFGMSYVVGWYDLYASDLPKNYETKDWCDAKRQYYNPYSHLVNINYLKRFAKYKYSAYELFKGKCILEYLRTYEKYPQVELLLKHGISSYLAVKKTLLIKVAKDKQFRKWIINNKNYLFDSRYTVATILQAYKNNIAIEKERFYEQWNCKLDNSYRKTLILKYIGEEKNKLFDYLDKQGSELSLYYDYLQACEALNIDMTLSKHKYPKDLKVAHDLRIEQQQAKEKALEAQKRKEIKASFIAVSNKYLCLEKQGKAAYIAIIAKKPEDLTREGKMLNHCVGGMNYSMRFAEEKSLIFFIRSIESPNKPLVTLEYSLENHKILQCYAYNDTKPSSDILHFVNKQWLPYANRKIKQIAA